MENISVQRSKFIKPVFYKAAVIYSSENGKISGGSIQGLYDYYDNHPAAPEIKADISTVEIVGNIAYVKAESD